MDLTDLLNEAKTYDRKQQLEQALISQKDKRNAFSVERDYINSKEYHDKFEKLPLNKNVQEAIYKQAGRLLEFIDSLDEDRMSEEHLLALSARTGEFIVDNFEREGNMRRTSFSEEERQKIMECPDTIILMHNHSLNGRPSGQDLLAYLHNEKVRISLILCHDGAVYGIYGVKREFEAMYNETLEKHKGRMSDYDMVKQLATTEMYRLNDVLSSKSKLFNVVNL